MSRRLAGVFALLSWAAPLVLPYAVITGGAHGCTEQVCRCGHQAPAKPSPESCHGHESKPADCQMSATCNHPVAMALVAGPVYDVPAVAEAPTPARDAQALASALPASVRHGFARLEPHPPPVV